MILCSIADSETYATLSPQIRLALKWINEHSSEVFDPGVIPIGKSPAGNDIYVKIETPVLLPREKVMLEAHRNYIDIQLPIRGPEKMGWATTESMKLPRTDYDSSSDIIFYGDSATTIINVLPGQLAIFFPSDAHAPNIGLGNHKKIIVKVPVE